MNEEEQAARERALGLLARREHSRTELARKLRAKGFSPAAVDPVLDQLVRENLLSEERFTEAWLRQRIQKGYGPVRLRQELRERGIDDALIDAGLDALDVDWMENLQSVREKKFGPAPPAGYREQAAESRFLLYRGYTMEQIRSLYETKQHDQ